MAFAVAFAVAFAIQCPEGAVGVAFETKYISLIRMSCYLFY